MSNTRNLNIQLCNRSLRELYKLAKCFRAKEKSDAFIVRFGMMKSLAKDALAYSLVSYLDERREYSIIADKLDDIYIQISRSELRKMASEYEDIVLCKFNAMYEVLGMIDERLKTVRVVSNRYANQQTFVNIRPTKQCAAVNHPIPTRNCPKPNPNAGLRKTSEQSKVLEPNVQTYGVKTPYVNTQGRRTVGPPLVTAVCMNTDAPGHQCIRPDAKEDTKDTELNEFIAYMVTKFDELNRLNNAHIPRLSSSDALKQKLEIICDIFNHIRGNADYIATNYAFHKPTKKSGISFIQHAIRKCPFLIDNINTVYDNIRDSVTRIDPELRREKRNTIDLLKTVQDILCKIYNENTYDKESV